MSRKQILHERNARFTFYGIVGGIILLIAVIINNKYLSTTRGDNRDKSTITHTLEDSIMLTEDKLNNSGE